MKPVGAKILPVPLVPPPLILPRVPPDVAALLFVEVMGVMDVLDAVLELVEVLDEKDFVTVDDGML
jgi:hypothetical protein